MPKLMINKRSYSVKGVLFDKDGTLLDFISLWGYWSESLYRNYSSKVLAVAKDGIIDPISDLWGTVHDAAGHMTDYSRNGPLAMGSIGDLLAILAWQGYRLGLPWSESMRIARESKRLADEEMEQVRPAYPLPGVMDFLRQCHDQGMPMGIVTADETADAEKHLQWLGIRQFFKVIVGNDLVKQGKPFPEMVHKACLELGLAPNQVALIGDTNSDMQMGRSAGVAATIGVMMNHAARSGDCWLNDASVLISSYAELHLEESTDEG
ncbi:HAD family hydrolase [Paenibacillus aceris]|uniref:Phosphoglycolate phosphatase n=1 Tax=Paenibacillus aceris TaxID=869555 RepID=A0ABS4HWR3_9BACL|nr:HAD family hydrolase [Paenibacillus aceris]MBP1963092.1 phosphoglycolate phosphatase [Paenibacillus aceris]NHW38788.1 HAD family hydrolase [Paenibacillus aceris]